MKLEAANPQYEKAFPDWRKVRDIIAGESQLKQHDLATTTGLRTIISQGENPVILPSGLRSIWAQYLPMPNPDDQSAQNQIRYAQYIQRACLFNATRRTEQGMVGMVYQKPTVIALPDELLYLTTDADGSELGLEQQAGEVLQDLLETGREGLLVDYPQTDGPTTVAQAQEMGIRATIAIYKAEAILDWGCRRIGAAKVLEYVKLCEVVEERDSEMAVKMAKQYRVLMLNEAGQYMQRIYKEDGTYSEVMPRKSDGRPFGYIPFYFVGSINNSPDVNPAPLLDIATVNLHHYRDSADWQESSFMVGQPTPVFAGLTSQWLKDVFEDGEIHIGSRAAVPLPAGGSATLLQASPNTMPAEGMKAKEAQMVALGARLITPGGQAETAQAVYIKHSADASVLKIIIRNINQAYRDALQACADFMGADAEEITFKINDEFLVEKLDGPSITALVASWQAGVISKPVLDNRLVKGGVIPDDTDLEAMNDEIDATPRGPGLGFGM